VPEGRRNLWVKLEAEGQVARIQVADDGVGIATLELPLTSAGSP
jgi:signal transduction histidine kinase